ncbi:MAG: hypothetical protein H6624_06510 [Bdellovibrionaceae bacterium]|nr:hypothetical protein [Bdellovibrionales bacterium]MCB9083976.1 hypothetical protein [Pseudobdellovibrionaceae bacterium]
MEAIHDPGSNGLGDLKPTFKSVSAVIFANKCVECHSGAKTPHGIDLSSYGVIKGNNSFPPLLVPGNPLASSLYRSIANDSMPKDRPPLSFQEKQAIYEWILQGGLEVPKKDGEPECEKEDCQPGEPPDEPGPLPGEPPDEPPNECEPGEPCDETEP